MVNSLVWVIDLLRDMISKHFQSSHYSYPPVQPEAFGNGTADVSMPGGSIGGGQGRYNAWGQSHTRKNCTIPNADETSIEKHCARRYANLRAEVNCSE